MNISGENGENLININTLQELLKPNTSTIFNQEKWIKDVLLGTVTITDVAYTLKLTTNKRKPILHYNADNKFYYVSDTIPYNYDDINH